MFDEEQLKNPPPKEVDPFDFGNCDVPQLIMLRQRIEALLPARKLTDIDLETEIVLQLTQAKHLQSAVLADSHCPANQKAQVANSCAAVLDQLIKMQVKLYDAERMKAIEQSLIKAVKTLPVEAQQMFFVEYERIHGEGT